MIKSYHFRLQNHNKFSSQITSPKLSRVYRFTDFKSYGNQITFDKEEDVIVCDSSFKIILEFLTERKEFQRLFKTHCSHVKNFSSS